jgi:hypothetical protein
MYNTYIIFYIVDNIHNIICNIYIPAVMSTHSELFTLISSDSTLSQISDIFPKCKIYGITTGNATKLISTINTTPGSSACNYGFNSPYAYSATADVLHKDRSEIKCNKETAFALAKQAYNTCCKYQLEESAHQATACPTQLDDSYKLESLDSNIIGIGITGALATSRPKAGPHHAFICFYTSNTYTVYLLNMEKNKRTRVEEDDCISHLVYHLLLDHCDIKKIKINTIGESDLAISSTPLEVDPATHRVCRMASDQFIKDMEGQGCRASLNLLEGDKIYILEKHITCQQFKYEWNLNRFLRRDIRTVVCVSPDSNIENSKFYEDLTLPAKTVIYPGTFNPLHEGHLEILRSFLSMTSHHRPRPIVLFEYCLNNVDKQDKDIEKLKEIIMQFNGENPMLRFLRGNQGKGYFGFSFGIILTRAPKFVDKSIEFKNCYLLCGADTMTRIFMTKYYRDAGAEEGNGENEENNFRATLNMISALTTISNNGVLIWVARRICRALTAKTESYETLTTLLQKEEYRKYFTLQFYSLFHEIPNNRIDLSSSEIRATPLHLLTSSSENVKDATSSSI